MSTEQTLGRYRLLSLLATGGMGEVFLARQEGPAGFSKTVVVKRILRHLARDQGFIDQFVNEARLAALLQHPNIAQVFGLEHENDTWFMAMEYVHGRSLRLIIDQCRAKGVKMPLPFGVRLASQVLQGLHSAHELTSDTGQALGVLHRDVTPENVLVSFAGQAKLVDFGIAKAMSNATLRRQTPWGKLPYMAPELVNLSPPADRRADIYSLGVAMHELLTLDKPPNVTAAFETLSVPKLSYAPSGALPPVLEGILSLALAVEPNDRWATAADMSQALEAWLTATGQTVVPTDVAAFLVELFGAAAAEQHPSKPVKQAGTQPVSSLPPLTTPTDLTRHLPHELSGERTTNYPAATRVSTRAVLAVATVTVAVSAALIWVAVTSAAGRTEVVNAAPAPKVVDSPPARAPDPGADVVDAGTASPPDVPEEAPQKATGKVTFKLNPGVEVLVDNQSLGMSPLKAFDLPVGKHRVTLIHVRSGVQRSQVITVKSGASMVIKTVVGPKQRH